MKMDKNIIRAIVVSFIIIMALQYIQLKLYPPEKQTPSDISESLPVNNDTTPEPVKAQEYDTPSDEVVFVQNNDNSINDTFAYEGNLYSAVLTEQGGLPKSIKLLKYKNDDDKFIELVGSMEVSGLLPLALKPEPGRPGELSAGHFEGKKINETQFVFTRMTTGPGGIIPQGIILEKEYTFHPDTYIIELNLRFTNNSQQSISLNHAKLSHKDEIRWGSMYINWEPGLGGNPYIQKHAMQYTESFAYNVDDKVKKHNKRYGGKKQKNPKLVRKTIIGKIKWAAMENQYFAVAVIPRVPSLALVTTQKEDGTNEWDMLLGELSLKPGESYDYFFRIYAGPKITKTLAAEGSGLIQLDGMEPSILPVSIARWMIKLLHLFYRFTGNYGWAILFVTVIMRILLFPLTHKSLKSMKEMQVIQPELKKIHAKYKNNKEKLNVEIMKLYKKHKVNPMGGCLPMFIQIPIFFALYIALRQSIELRGAPFMLWMKDLSAPDTVYYIQHVPVIGMLPVNILPIMMFVTMLLQQQMTANKKPGSDQERMQMQMMKMMNIFFLFIFWNLPSGLVLYWTLSNVFQLAQQIIINKMNLIPAGSPVQIDNTPTEKEKKNE